MKRWWNSYPASARVTRRRVEPGPDGCCDGRRGESSGCEVWIHYYL